MRYSMKLKLFFGISSLIVFYMALSLLLNSQFLSKYYIYSKHKQLNNDYAYINRIYTGDPDDISLELEKLERSEGIHIMIWDRKMNFEYGWFQRNRENSTKSTNSQSGKLTDSNSRIRPRLKGFELKPDPPLKSNSRKESSENLVMTKLKKLHKNETIIYNTKDRRLNSEFINLIGVLKSGDYIHLSTARAAIEESVNIANKLFAFTGLITIIIGMVFVYIASGRITKPIRNLNTITAKMSTLDFSEKYLVQSNDEIGQLGQSINSLSEQLEKSITKLKLSNDKLKKDIERERKIDDMRKEFVSNVSHELKTPIALIQGYAEGLKVNVNEDEENKNYYCDVIIDEASKMNRLVKQLLDLSLLESGGLKPEKEVFDLNQLISEILKKNSLIFKEYGIDIFFDNCEAINVNADIYMIEQVIMNFLSNAVNHVDEGKVVRVSVKKKNGKAQLGVYNSGKHIPEDLMNNIWTSFYKIDKARTRAYGGTGLGLSIVRAIMEQHGNVFGVKNVDCGVYFWVELDM